MKDAVKYAKEVAMRKSDMVFDTVENSTATISRILERADRIVPGHFPELIKLNGVFEWDDTAEFALIVR